MSSPSTAGDSWAHPPRLAGTLRGRVAAFSPERCTGEVEDGTGRRFPFHGVEISDGSRRIAEGTVVCFCLRPGLAGLLEAAQLVPVAPS